MVIRNSREEGLKLHNIIKYLWHTPSWDSYGLVPHRGIHTHLSEMWQHAWIYSRTLRAQNPASSWHVMAKGQPGRRPDWLDVALQGRQPP